MDKNNHTNQPHLQEQRRQLRKESTPAEVMLWKMLKNNQVEGVRFRRQFSVDNYILDFYCPQVRLAIELDGEVHNQAGAAYSDEERTLYLKERFNIKVIRFENSEVFDYPERVVEEIREELLRRLRATSSMNRGGV